MFLVFLLTFQVINFISNKKFNTSRLLDAAKNSVVNTVFPTWTVLNSAPKCKIVKSKFKNKNNKTKHQSNVV